MALKDTAVNLVLRARNLLSGDLDAASKSVEELAGNAEGLQGKLRSLEDQGALVRQFQSASKAVDRTSSAYERAKLRADKLADKIGQTGVVTKRQAQEFDIARAAVDKAEKEYKAAEGTLEELGEEAEAAGVDIGKLGKEQRRIAEETKKARRAQADLNSEVERSDSRFKSFRSNLSKGVVTFGKWAAAASAAGAALAVGALTRFTTSQADLARQTLASADAFGVSAVELQKWQYAANEVGISGEKTSDIMKDVAEKIGDAFLNGGGEAREVIRGLGLDLERLAGMRPDEQILAIAKELDGMPKAGQIQVLEAMASDASLLLPLLDDNAKKLRELSNEAESRGAIFSEDELKQLAEVNTQFRKITARISGFAKEIVIKAAPAFEKLAKAIDTALKDKPELVDNIAAAFTKLIEITAKWAESLSRDTGKISADVSKLGNSVDGMRQLFIAAFRGVQSFGAGSAEVVARIVYDWNRAKLAIVEALNTIGIASDEAVREATFAVDNAATSVADLKKQSEDYQAQMVAAGKAASDAFSRARDGAAGVATTVKETAVEIHNLGTEADAAGEKIENFASKREALASEEQKLAASIEETALALEAAGAAMAADGTPEQAAEVERLNAKYSEQLARLRELREEMQNLASPVNTSESQDGGTTSGITETYREATGAIEETGRAAANTANTVNQTSEKLAESGNTVERVGQQAKASSESMATGFGQLFAGMAEYVNNLSAKAGDAFREMLGGREDTDIGSALEQRLERVNALLTYTQNRVTNGGVSTTLNRWAEAAYKTEQRFLEQAVAVEKLTEKILSGDRASRYLRMSADDVARSFDLLDENQLRPLIGAIQSAQREIKGLNDSLLDTIANTRQELASLAGDTAEVERLRYEQRRFELEQQLAKAEALGDKETIRNAKEALRLTEEAYKLRQKQAAERSAEAEQRALEYEQREADRRNREEQEERQDISRDEERSQAQTNQLDKAASSPRTVRLELGSGGIFTGVDGIPDSVVDQLIDALERAGFTSTR